MYSSPLTSPPSLREFRAHFQALASLTRLRILQHLAGVPQTTVQDLADALDVSQPRLSWHLRMLRPADRDARSTARSTVKQSMLINANYRVSWHPGPRSGRPMKGARYIFDDETERTPR